jgi:hypothetical protein
MDLGKSANSSATDSRSANDPAFFGASIACGGDKGRDEST